MKNILLVLILAFNTCYADTIKYIFQGIVYEKTANITKLTLDYTNKKGEIVNGELGKGMYPDERIFKDKFEEKIYLDFVIANVHYLCLVNSTIDEVGNVDLILDCI